MTKWLKNLLALGIITFLVWYLARHWEQLKALFRLSPKQLFVMYCLWFLIALSGARAVQCLLSALKIKTGFWDMVRLHHASLLLNYVPVKFGTVFRANYLKRHYGLAYTHFATFFLYITFLMTAIAAIIGLTVLLIIYGLSGNENKILGGVFAITIIGSLPFLVVPLPVPTGQGRLSTTFRTFLTGRSQMSKERKTILKVAALLGVNFLFDAVRLWIIYSSMGKNINVGGYLILGALGFVVLFIGLTPGSLGIRELVLGFGATVVGMPLEVGVLAAVIDRAIIISYVFIAGSICTVWLWHKSPADFSKQQDGSSA
ncbi:MAG: flippase-like domain-containing protein [Sedimentisphaerales bacterium]|nr:flippase-like domain-containing protein [Sedimentisphaerales bacterium]